MPVFDTPINTDDNNLQKVMQQKLPVILYLYNRPNASLDTALKDVAKEYAGKLLAARVDASRNPQANVQYKHAALPAIFSIKSGEIQSQSSPAQPSDIKSHANYLLGTGPKPTQKAPEPQPTEAHPVAVSDGSFAKDVLQSKIPVLVDFWAPWCGPCRMVAPILENLAPKYAGKLKIVKLNVDDNPQTASQYQTFSIPTLILFKDGRQVNKLVGAHPQTTIERLIQSVT